MNSSSSLVFRILTWAQAILNEVDIAMSNSYVTEPETKDNVVAAQQSIERLLNNNQADIDKISENIEYEKLVMKLQAQNMPIEPELWNTSCLD